tara:strand:+ start:914 stop:1459 length:546 start_codon:yes stop_codon:yes gene_type:complete
VNYALLPPKTYNIIISIITNIFKATKKYDLIHSMNNKIPPPIVTLVFGLAIYFSKPLFPDFSNVILNVLSLLLIIVGLLTLISAARSFKVQETTINPINIDKATSLVVSGVFKYSRNPMYLGMVLILLSISFKFNLIGGIVLTMLFTGYITTFQIIPEEIVMNKLFGDEFEKYKNKTRRWI